MESLWWQNADRSPELMIMYTPTGTKNPGWQLQRPLDIWGNNESTTNGTTPWQFDFGYDDVMSYWVVQHKHKRSPSLTTSLLGTGLYFYYHTRNIWHICLSGVLLHFLVYSTLFLLWDIFISCTYLCHIHETSLMIGRHSTSYLGITDEDQLSWLKFRVYSLVPSIKMKE
jgi:hypothetical protein